MNANDRLIAILAEMQTFDDVDYHLKADKQLCEVVTILANHINGEAGTIAIKIVEAFNAESFPKWYA